MEDLPRTTNLDLKKFKKISNYFKKIRKKYSQYEGSLKGADTQMLVSQVPGGMLSNLESQLKDLNKSDLLEEVIKEIPKVREDFGFPPLVTPVSQIVGAQALMNVSENKPYETLSKETINLLTGHYGRVPGNVNKEILKKAETEQDSNSQRPADFILDDYEERKKDLKNFCEQNKLNDFSLNEEMLLCFIQFPYSTTDYLKSIE